MKGMTTPRPDRLAASNVSLILPIDRLLPCPDRSRIRTRPRTHPRNPASPRTAASERPPTRLGGSSRRVDDGNTSNGCRRERAVDPRRQPPVSGLESTHSICVPDADDQRAPAQAASFAPHQRVPPSTASPQVERRARTQVTLPQRFSRSTGSDATRRPERQRERQRATPSRTRQRDRKHGHATRRNPTRAAGSANRHATVANSPSPPPTRATASRSATRSPLVVAVPSPSSLRSIDEFRARCAIPA